MPRSTTIYRTGRDGTVEKIPVDRAPAEFLSDNERLQIEGSQGEKVLRGYRELEASGHLRRHYMKESPETVKRAWAPEVTGRFN